MNYLENINQRKKKLARYHFRRIKGATDYNVANTDALAMLPPMHFDCQIQDVEDFQLGKPLRIQSFAESRSTTPYALRNPHDQDYTTL
jgi:hypothetical protein